MNCSKCGHNNAEATRFCVRCHMTLRFICPACEHIQPHGGKCEGCGVDFMKYAAVLQLQMEETARAEREKAKARSAAVRQIVLLPVTGGWSLLKYVKSALTEE